MATVQDTHECQLRGCSHRSSFCIVQHVATQQLGTSMQTMCPCNHKCPVMSQFALQQSLARCRVQRCSRPNPTDSEEDFEAVKAS